MEISRIGIKRFQRGWRILIIFTVLFWIGALIWSVATTPLYRAEAKFLVYPNDNLTSSRDVVSSLDTLDKKSVSTTYADILSSNRVYQDTVERLRLSDQDLRDVVVYTNVQADTNILVLNVEGRDPKLVTELANSIGQNGISYIKSIYQVFDISFLDLAVEPQTPYKPRPLIDGLIAAAIGLGVGLIFLILRELLRVPIEALRERSMTDKQSLAWSKKYLLHSMNDLLAKNKGETLAFGLIYLRGLEDLIDGLPQHITTNLMQTIVRRFHDLLRGNDIVARWDRLSYSILLPSTPEIPAVKTFERLLSTLEEPAKVGAEEPIPLQPLAILVTRKGQESVEQLLSRALEALRENRDSAERIVVVK